MSRGRPGLWSTLVAVPFVAAGAAAYYVSMAFLLAFGLPLVVLGVFVLVVGWYVKSVAPSPPEFREDEELVETRRPRYRIAAVKVALSAPFFIGAPFLLFFTLAPYLWPTLLMFGGLFFFFSGYADYCRNLLTMYYLTDQRIISVYRFLSIDRKEIPLEKVRLIRERKSIWETFLKLGNVQVVTGGTQDLQVRVRHIPDPTPFAEEIRNRSAAKGGGG